MFFLSALAMTADMVGNVSARFEPTVAYAVSFICAIGHDMKSLFSSSIGSGSAGDSTACYGFVSLRRSLDASDSYSVA